MTPHVTLHALSNHKRLFATFGSRITWLEWDAMQCTCPACHHSTSTSMVWRDRIAKRPFIQARIWQLHSKTFESLETSWFHISLV